MTSDLYPSESLYSLRGVSSKKEDVHKAIKNLDKGLYPYAFCKIIPNYVSKNKNPFQIMHTDGAGTKTIIAYLYWKETGDYSVWKGIAQDAIVMNLDDMFCAGASDNFILSSIITRNKHLIDGKVIGALIDGVEEFINKMRIFGINIYSSGGETEDVGDLVRTIGFNVTISSGLKKNEVIDNSTISPGDCIIGFSSSGQTSYETKYNSGIGCNGLTSARHDILKKTYAKKFPESYDPGINKKLIFCGKYSLLDPTLKPYKNISELLLSPTRTYAPVLKEIFHSYRKQIHGLIHCTGGGQTKIFNYINKLHIIKDNLFEIPYVFTLIQKESSSLWHEMYQVFNMGQRLELYTKEKYAPGIIKIADSFNLKAQVIGHVEKYNRKKLSIKTKFGNFTY